MALTQTIDQMETSVRLLTDTLGTNALVRHPQSSVFEYINRGIAALYRILTEAAPDQRALASSVVTMVSGTAVYPLPATFDHLLSVDLTANGSKRWLTAYALSERPMLTDPSNASGGVPLFYRLQGASSVEYLPTPTSAYTSTLWYVPAVAQLTTGQTFDTIARLDEYIIWHAATQLAARDKNWDLCDRCKQWMAEMRTDIQAIARSRDKNSPPRIVDEQLATRWGRRAPGPRGYR